MSAEARDALTILSLFGVILPSVAFALLTLKRVRQVMSRFGRANQTVRRRFTIAKSLGAVSSILLFISFQSYLPLGAEMRTFVFMAAIVALLDMFGFNYLAWDQWWQGLDSRRRQR